MKKWIPILVLLVVAGGGAYYYYAYGKPKEEPTVTTATISQADIVEIVQATGTLEATRIVQVGSQVSGIVKELYADFNQIVKKDQLIAEIDPSLLQVQVQIQEANIQRQEGDISNQEVQLEDSKVQLARTQKLFDAQLANQQQLDAAILTVKSRQASIDSARKSLISANASLDQAKLNLSYTKIYSPIEGVVVNRVVDKGQTVQASMSTPQFFTIATDLRTLKLTASVDESEIGKIQPDMQVTFTVDSYQGQTFFGTVNAVRLNATNNQGVVTYPVWIDAPNPDLKLRPSMTATVHVIIQTASNAIRIPNQALRFRPNTEIYTALGLQPPTAGTRSVVDAGGARGGDRGGAAGTGAPGTGAPANAANAPAGAPATGAPAGAPAANGNAVADGAGGNQRGNRQRNADGQGQGQSGNGQNVGRGGQGAGGQFAQNGQGGPGGRGGDNSGRGGQGGGNGGRGGTGFGGGGGGGNRFANMTAEERQRMMAQFQAGGGGRGGNGQGGGARGGGRNAAPANVGVQQKSLEGADKIDELFQPTPKRIMPGAVWTWNKEKKELKEIRVRTGVTDGQFSELMLPSELTAGTTVVTGVIIPQTQQQRNQNNQNIFNQRGGQGGFPGGGQPGGGQGGRGGGGAGGGGGGGRGGD